MSTVCRGTEAHVQLHGHMLMILSTNPAAIYYAMCSYWYRQRIVVGHVFPILNSHDNKIHMVPHHINFKLSLILVLTSSQVIYCAQEIQARHQKLKARIQIYSSKPVSKHTESEEESPALHIAMHEFHENCHSITFYFMKRDSKYCCDTTTPESIHTEDESKRGSAFAFIFGVNWPVQWM